MAFTSCTVTVNNIASLSDLPNTTDGLSSTQLKQKFDQTGTDLKTYINSTLLSELASTTTGSSASENIGGRLISAKSVIAGISAGTLYSQLNSLHTQLNSFVAGTGFIPTTGGTFTGAVEFPLGTVSAASINAGDVDTGIYFPASATFAITNNGVETFRTTSNNRLLIGGTTSFTTRLGTTNINPNFQFQGLDDNNALLTSKFSADTEAAKMFFSKSRGTTTGSHGSVLSGDEIGIISFGASDGNKIVEGARISSSVDGTPGVSDMPGKLSFMTTPDNFATPTEKMRIANDGVITFNSYTTAGFLKNSVAGVISTNTSETGTGSLVLATSPTFTTSLDGDATFSAFPSVTALTMSGTSGTTTIRNSFRRSGNISSASWTTTGINASFAGGTYTDTTSAVSDVIATRVGTNWGQPTLASTNAITVTNAATVYIAGAPIAGTNTTITNAYALNVASGKVTMDGVYGTTVGATNRDLYIDNTGLLGYVTSTEVSKKNIKSISDTDWLLSLNPVEFNYRKKDSQDNYLEETYSELEYGLIAEEVESVNSELCFYDEIDGNKELRGVHYSKLITPILKLVQEQQQLIEQLQTRIELLESKVN
jgi:hypothetical protein